MKEDRTEYLEEKNDEGEGDREEVIPAQRVSHQGDTTTTITSYHLGH